MNVTADEARGWVRQYEDDGMTLEQIALEAGYATQTVRKWLTKLGYTPRPAGAQVGVQRLNVAYHKPLRDQRALRPTARIVRPSVQRGYR